MSVAERQLIEIARLLARDAQILILDEPTAALSDDEIEMVTSTVARLAERGHSVIYVTHRLGEVFDIAHRVTVFRGGESNPPQPIADLTLQSVIELMIGRPLDEMFPARAQRLGGVVLDVAGLGTADLRGPISLQARAGEIVGIAGQIGSGSGGLLRAIAGVDISEQGRVSVAGKTLAPGHSLVKAISAGLAYCSDDRKYNGIFGGLPVNTNMTAPALPAVSPRGLLNRRRENMLARKNAAEVALSHARLPHRAGTLSGGNQQKVALGKWLGIEPRVLLVHEPTRGVDVGARAEIYGHLRRLADQGLAIVFASSDLDEVHGLADTVVTMFRGRVVRWVPATAITTREMLRDITHPEGVSA